jgi:hypothetical protein
MQEPVSRQYASQPSAPLAAGLRLPFRHECRRRIKATAEALFSYLDDHRRLAGHMSKPSWMMAGASMQIEFDAQKGQVVGSRIRLSGRVLGLDLHVEEVVTEHTAPLRKVWATVDSPELLVIGPYRMGFEITPDGDASDLRIFIDYAWPAGLVTRWLGRALGGAYARWCTESMAEDAAAAFAQADLKKGSSTEVP